VLTPDDVQRWLDAYVEAWRTYDEAAIRALFAPGASYAFHPNDDPVHGPDAIAAAWLRDRDDPDSWEATYAPALTDGNAAIAKGETRYPAAGHTFRNLFELEFDDEHRCTRFVEWYARNEAE
jgi:SnoaL-like domain